MVSSVATVHSQGILDATNDSATDFLTEVLTGPLDLPHEYAVVLRFEVAVLDDRKGASTSDGIYLYSERARDNNRLVVHSLANLREGYADRRLWQQTLTRGINRSRRSANLAPPFTSVVTERLDTDPKESRIHNMLAEFHPYFFSIAQMVDAHAGRVDGNYSSYVLQHYELLDSKRTENGTLGSTWRLNKLQLKIEFDPKQGNRPVRIVRLGLPTDGDDSGERPIQAIHYINWKKWQWSNDQSIWVPAFLRRHDIDRNSKSEKELECYFKWKDTTKTSAIPKVEDVDWREPIRELFEEDWAVDYQGWLRSQPPEN